MIKCLKQAPSWRLNGVPREKHTKRYTKYNKKVKGQAYKYLHTPGTGEQAVQ